MSGVAQLLGAALFWNGVTWLVAVPFVVFAENAPWYIYLFFSLFVLVGAWLAIVAVRRILAGMKLHRPQISVSMQPLLLGEEFTGQFEQLAKSHANINRVTVKLVCRESTTYTAGTTTNTVTKDVFTQVAELPDQDRADAATPLRGEFRFRIPSDAMHCFRASNNVVEWLIETHTDIHGWPDYTASFSLEVAPGRFRPDSAIFRRKLTRQDEGMSASLQILLDPGDCGVPGRPEHFAPGERLTGHIVATVDEPTNCRGLTVTIGWHTEGRGTKDSQPHFEDTLHEGPIEPGGQRFPFVTTLPEGPLSYAGHYVNVVWHVRARLDLAWRIDPKVERTFYLSLP